MKNLKNLILFSVVIMVFAIVDHLYNNQDNDRFFKTLIIICVFLFAFHFLIRKNIRFKKYFTSRYNIFSGKYRTELVYDMPVKLFYEKVKEVVENSTLKLKYSNDEKFQLFAITPVGWRSWGENVYIDFEEDGGRTKMKFCSAAVLGMISWGKNEGNYTHLIRNIEESLII